MKEKLVPTTVYIQPATKRAIRQAAKMRRCTDAEVVREALAAGLERLEDKQPASLEGMRRLIEFAEKHTSSTPADLSDNLDKYLWDE